MHDFILQIDKHQITIFTAEAELVFKVYKYIC